MKHLFLISTNYGERYCVAETPNEACDKVKDSCKGYTGICEIRNIEYIANEERILVL